MLSSAGPLSRLTIRPISENDRERYRQLLLRLTEDDRRLRFFHAIRNFSDQYVTPFVENADGVVGFVAETDEAIVGAGHALSGSAGIFELAIVVDARWRHLGVAGMLLERIIDELRRRGARALIADSLSQNTQFTTLALEHGLDLVATEGDLNRWRIELRGTA